MPGVDKPDINHCGPTHHFACTCREAMFKELDRLYRQIMNREPHSEHIVVFNRIVELREALGLTK